MKSQSKPFHLQLKLLLAEHTPSQLPADKQNELTLALVELLLGAAGREDIAGNEARGGGHEPEADQ